MIKNLWKDIELVCGNHSEPNIKLEPKIAESLFYSCPKYYDFNRNPGERICANRISGIDYERMVSHISSKLEEAALNYEHVWLQGYTFTIKQIDFKVIEHTDNKIIVSVINRKALGRKI